MNEAETMLGNEIMPGQANYATLISVEKAKMYQMGYHNALGDQLNTLFMASDLITAGATLLKDSLDLRSNDPSHDIIRTIYFGSVELLRKADLTKDRDTIVRAVSAHSWVVRQIESEEIACDGFYSLPAYSAKRDWGKYEQTPQLRQTFTPGYYAELYNCSQSWELAQFILGTTNLVELADDRDVCDDYNDSDCWFCSYDQ